MHGCSSDGRHPNVTKARSTRQLTGVLKCYIECKKREKSLFTRTPGWEEMVSGSVCVWNEHVDKPLRAKE